MTEYLSIKRSRGKVVYMARSQPEENLLPLSMGPIINYFSNATEVVLWVSLMVAVDPSQLRTTVQGPPYKCDCNRQKANRVLTEQKTAALPMRPLRVQ